MTDRLATYYFERRKREMTERLICEVERMRAAKHSADIVDLTKLVDLPELPARLMDGGEVL